jgi:pyrimidine-nucleoside phosphorylase
MGAGRTRADQRVDHAVGIVLRARRGDRVRKGDVVAELHVRDASAAKTFAKRVEAAYEIGRKPPRLRPLVFEIVRR